MAAIRISGTGEMTAHAAGRLRDGKQIHREENTKPILRHAAGQNVPCGLVNQPAPPAIRHKEATIATRCR